VDSTLPTQSQDTTIANNSALATEYQKDAFCRILSLDGGGAKGFYTLGVLKQIEGLLGCPLYKRFDLVFGTSTGAIIAALIALGYSVDSIFSIYKKHVPTIMSCRTAGGRSNALSALAAEVFKKARFEDVKTGIGIVATKWDIERPMIFKASVEQAHGSKGTFTPGFGVLIADAVEASCSAYPFFKRKTVKMSDGTSMVLVDGGFCANNPALYALADAVRGLGKAPSEIRLVTVGVGEYPSPKKWNPLSRVIGLSPAVRLLQKVLEFNTQSLDQLRAVLFKDIPTLRINDSFPKPEMATDLMEKNQKKLDLLYQRGRESFRSREDDLKKYLL
jgi:uncharacterized protein